MRLLQRFSFDLVYFILVVILATGTVGCGGTNQSEELETRASEEPIQAIGETQQAETPTPDAVCRLLATRRAEVVEPAIAKLSEEELEKVSKKRTCIKNFPWPKDESFETVSAQRMAELRQDIAAAVVKYQTGRLKEADLSGLELHQLLAMYVMEEGRDPQLLRLYSDFLAAFLQNREGELSGVLQTIEEVELRIGVVTARDSSFDTGDENTYFSHDSLMNLLFLLKTRASLANGYSSEEEQLQAANAYAEHYPALANYFALTGGNQLADLEEVLGCAQVADQ